MSFGDHLEELRKRVFWALAAPVPVFVALLFLGQPLLEFLTAPLLSSLKQAGEPAHLIATSPVEPFAAYVKVAMVATLLVAMPWMLYQLWLFVAPGLYAKERRFVYFLLPLSGLLTTAGLVFLYYVLLPLSLFFLIEFGTGLVRHDAPRIDVPAGVVLPSVPMLAGDPGGAKPGEMWLNQQSGELRIGGEGGRVYTMPLRSGAGIAQEYRLAEYVDLVFLLGLAFAFAAQLPVVLMLLSWVGMINHTMLSKYRRHAAFGAVVLGALLPTQDPGSLLLLGGVLYSLYELGIVLMRFMPASRVAKGWWRWSAPPAPAPGYTDGHLGDD